MYRSTAAAVGIERANPWMPFLWKYGMQSKLLAITAKLSLGVTKKASLPNIIFLSYNCFS